MQHIRLFLQRLTPALFATAALCGPAHAADAICSAAGMTDANCRQPVMGEWAMWRYVVNDKTGPLRPSEEQAIEDAVRLLREAYPCGITHALTPAPYTATANLWSWPIREDAMRIQFVGFAAGDTRSCSGSFGEQRGFVLIRRERKVSCPKDFNWLVRDDKPGICIKD
ncbi:hypothetical protein [Viridibacterium curvum]|uniref:Uncharacterized protein n=1 Tax=Viridibacterium curvum TaxID=1101404 RepID=A0ABP9QSL5_9RHOO